MNQLTSGQIAELFNISKSKLRFYIDKGLLKPKIDENNGYYIFNEFDIYRLYQIIFFRKIGISIAEISKSQTMDLLVPLLENSKILIEKEIEKLIEIKRLTSDILEINQNNNFEEVSFLEYEKRFFKKLPEDIIQGSTIDFTDVQKNKNALVDNPYFIYSKQELTTAVCTPTNESDYDCFFPKGTYATIYVLVNCEESLMQKIRDFLEDPLFKIKSNSENKILVYENILYSLAYSNDIVYTVEVSL